MVGGDAVTEGALGPGQRAGCAGEERGIGHERAAESGRGRRVLGRIRGEMRGDGSVLGALCGTIGPGGRYGAWSRRMEAKSG